jgi:hypothetical protein
VFAQCANRDSAHLCATDTIVAIYKPLHGDVFSCGFAKEIQDEVNEGIANFKRDFGGAGHCWL